MLSLSSRDIEDVLTVGRAAIESHGVDELRSKTLELLGEVFDSDRGSFFLSSNGGEELDLAGVISRGVENTFISSFRDYYHRLNPFHPDALSYATPVLTGEEILPFSDLVQTEYYVGFLKPQSIRYQLIILLRSEKRVFGTVYLFRPERTGKFSSQDRAKAELIVPNLTAAVERSVVLDQAGEWREILGTITLDLPYKGIIVANESLEPVYVNEKARNLLSALRQDSGSGEASAFSLPEELGSRCRKVLRSDGEKANSEADQQRFDGFSCPDGRELFVKIHRIAGRSRSAKVLICLCEDEPVLSLSQRLKRVGFTSRELEVVFLVYQGLRNTEVANKLFISEHTVENHLRAIYQKMGVKNRTSLIHQLIQLRRGAPPLIPIQDFPSL